MPIHTYKVLPGDAVIEDGEDSDKEAMGPETAWGARQQRLDALSGQVEAAEFHSITDCEEETQLEGSGPQTPGSPASKQQRQMQPLFLLNTGSKYDTSGI